MAELILTDEEKEVESFLDWSNESLGKMVRTVAQKIKNGEISTKPVNVTAAMYVIIMTATYINADSVEQTIENVSYKDYEMGDWKVTVERID